MDPSIMRLPLRSATGSLLCSRGKLRQAERYHKRALNMKEKLLGRNHVEIALTLNNLAVLYKAQGRFDAAAELYAGRFPVWNRPFLLDTPI